jgi:hypothetical protein
VHACIIHTCWLLHDNRHIGGERWGSFEGSSACYPRCNIKTLTKTRSMQKLDSTNFMTATSTRPYSIATQPSSSRSRASGLGFLNRARTTWSLWVGMNTLIGIMLDNCTFPAVPGLPTSTETYLGRPWKSCAQVIVMSSAIYVHINQLVGVPGTRITYGSIVSTLQSTTTCDLVHRSMCVSNGLSSTSLPKGMCANLRFWTYPWQ